MPSPDSWRPRFEWVLRALGFVAMIVLAIRLWSGSGFASTSTTVATAGLDSALVAWTASPPADARIDATRLPGASQRDWLVALRRTGTPLSWATGDSTGGALVVEAGPLPESPARITALTNPRQGVTIADELGRLDSSSAGRDGVAEWRARPIGAAEVNVGTAVASAVARDSLVTQPVLVIGQAGWESKFLVTALEEAGWDVAARLTIAPGAMVTQSVPARIDTSTLSAIVILDSTSSIDAGAIARFVSDGGGLIASGAGASHAALRQLLASRVATTNAGEIGGLLGPAPREGLSARTFVANAGAVALERRGNAPVVMARRIGSGRVIVTGYDDTWRVRMIPTGESAPESHRMWWSQLVASAAHSRPVARTVVETDEAPLAATIDALGAPAAAHRPSPIAHPQWEMWLALIAAAALLAEWLSRRLRGVA
jgi:hypothetical protein